MPGDRLDSQRDDAPAEPAWHERTGTLAGASAAALVAIALVYFLISTVARQFNEPDPAPGYYPDPGGTTSKYRNSYGSSSRTTRSTTSTTISVNAPITSDINPGDTTTSSGPSGTDTTTTEPSQLYPPQTRDGSTTRSRPRLNQTRTVYPPPP